MNLVTEDQRISTSSLPNCEGVVKILTPISRSISVTRLNRSFPRFFYLLYLNELCKLLCVKFELVM